MPVGQEKAAMLGPSTKRECRAAGSLRVHPRLHAFQKRNPTLRYPPSMAVSMRMASL
jgi:hypothetical protein